MGQSFKAKGLLHFWVAFGWDLVILENHKPQARKKFGRVWPIWGDQVCVGGASRTKSDGGFGLGEKFHHPLLKPIHPRGEGAR